MIHKDVVTSPCFGAHDFNPSATLGGFWVYLIKLTSNVKMYSSYLETFRLDRGRGSRYVFSCYVTHVKSAYDAIVRVTPVMDRANPT